MGIRTRKNLISSVAVGDEGEAKAACRTRETVRSEAISSSVGVSVARIEVATRALGGPGVASRVWRRRELLRRPVAVFDVSWRSFWRSVDMVGSLAEGDRLSIWRRSAGEA